MGNNNGWFQNWQELFQHVHVSTSRELVGSSRINMSGFPNKLGQRTRTFWNLPIASFAADADLHWYPITQKLTSFKSASQPFISANFPQLRGAQTISIAKIRLLYNSSFSFITYKALMAHDNGHQHSYLIKRELILLKNGNAFAAATLTVLIGI